MLITPLLRAAGVGAGRKAFFDFAVWIGRVPEWLKGTGCKPVGFGLRRFESYPFHQSVAQAIGLGDRVGRAECGEVEGRKVMGGRSSMVEPQPSKLVMRVRFPSPAPKPGGRIESVGVI